MRSTLIAIRNRMDRAGVVLSGLCAVHCVLGVVLVGFLGLGGDFLGGKVLLSPEIHRVGLMLAVIVGVISLGFGVARHRRVAPMVIGGLGLTLMGAAILVGHGFAESVLTIIGVSFVAFAHIRNMRHTH
ncbi:MerC domain-containing protein [Novosphingobium sp. BL-8A]|uniref:MerC domain-containing protein n=1 Tax=Novosphingobium sp. BL-8A TaxID=3127639 RepID=UPI0037583572